MGKNNRHKKFLKQEKAKVKLKAGKKLTKGQNITDTSFKAKKIVLQSQLTATPADQPQTKKKLNLKELLSRSKHHNVNMRVEALSGLRELTTFHSDVLATNLCNFLETAASRCTNEESNLVRQESLRLLQCVLDKVSLTQLEPFMSMLILHLSTGMTHLHREVQEDALRMLDLVLAVAPSLVAQAAPILLPAFLEQISVKRQVGGNRMLSLDLQSSNTSTRWRIKVLGRLHAMLSAVTSSSTTPLVAEQQPNTVYWSSTGSPYIPVYKRHIDELCVIDGIFPTGQHVLRGQTLFKDEVEMKKYILLLMPLLFETWCEAGPTQKQQRDTGSLIPAEAAEVLDCVLETIQHLWCYIQTCDQNAGNTELSTWFRKNFRKDFTQHVMEHFPYFTIAEGSVKKGRRGKGQAPFQATPEISCHSQNLAICHLFCCLCNKPTEKQANEIFSYTSKSLSPGLRVSHQLVAVLKCILVQESSPFASLGMSLDDLTSSAVQCCLNTQGNFQHSPLFELLCDLSLSAAQKARLSYSTVRNSPYTKFVEELPTTLTNSETTAKCLSTISRLAAVQNATLLQSVKLYLSRIVANLPVLTVAGQDQRAVQMSVLGVLYQACLWRTDILESTARCLVSENSHLVQHFRQLVQLKKEQGPWCAFSNKINSMQWFFQDTAPNPCAMET